LIIGHVIQSRSNEEDLNGVSLTAEAFAVGIPGYGHIILPYALPFFP